MALDLKIDLTGKDATVLSTIQLCSRGLASLEIYKKAPENLAQDKMDWVIGRYQATYEGGKNGDRIQIAQRRKARKEVTDFFNKLLSFLRAVASEEDIPSLQQAGVEVRQYKRKATTKNQQVVVAQQGSPAEQSEIVLATT